MKERKYFHYALHSQLRLVILLSVFITILTSPTYAQYTLEKAINEAIQNSSINNFNIIHAQIQEHKLDNISKNYLPKFSLSGQATYQSDVTELPIQLPGIEIDPITKDQYKIQGEIIQNIYDGGLTQKLKTLTNISYQLKEVETEIQLEELRSSVINQYFKILELQSQISIVKLKRANLGNNLKTIDSGIANGVLQNADRYELQASIIQIDQEMERLESYLNTSIKALQTYTKSELPIDSEFIIPPMLTENDEFTDLQIINKLDIQKELLFQNQELQERMSMPKAIAFVNLGYGKPALNFLRNSFEPYGIGGVRLAWNLDNLYTKNKERQIVQLNHELIEEQKEVIQTNLNIQKDFLTNELTLLKSLAAQDDELLDLRTKLRENAEAKLKNGVITANQLLPFVNQEAEMLEKKELRTLQIIKNQYLLEQLTGNYNK